MTVNMKIWDQVKITDPKQTKLVEFGKRRFTTIDPTWQLQEATKLWGPYGDKWGLRNLELSFVDTEGVDRGGNPFRKKSAILMAEFFYPAEGADDGAYFPIYVDDEFVCGDDSLKKLQTSARSKALSWLGFSADVFMGKFDDAGYQKRAEAKFADQDAFTSKVRARIKTSTTGAQLADLTSRIESMVADDIISASVGTELLLELDDRMRFVSPRS